MLITLVFRNKVICSKTKVQMVVHRVSGDIFYLRLIDDIVIPKTWLSAYGIIVLMVLVFFLLSILPVLLYKYPFVPQWDSCICQEG